MSKYDDLVRKLKEIFQIDRPELDFGVYRILNARVGEINDYLENRLKAKVTESFAASGTSGLDGLQRELKEKEAQYRSDGIDPESVPKVKELRQKIADLSSGSAEHENAVFTHLLTFFSRYYDKGDFISQRRYKGDTYAIPYAGEEVVLHWANKDQYYTKSSENFANYGFKLDDGRTVRFRLISADTAKDNRKDTDIERQFVLIERHTRILVDDDGDEYEQEFLPVEEVGTELVIRFGYKAMPKGSKQDELVRKATDTVLADPAVQTRWLDLSKREPTEKNPQRTLLEKCLTSYTMKNTADYFIHKDLGGFLRRELDFYIKTEVMHLDDVQAAERFSDIEKSLRLIQTFRGIALDLVIFLAQLENFQKQLWLKKKFVVGTSYCVTLDRIPEGLYPVIAANERQWDQWGQLGMLDRKNGGDLLNQAKAGSVEYLKDHQFLMADTALFEASFRNSLLAAIDNLDDGIDGLLIHGDNFQALNLLLERFQEQVTCIYIDPPYNTDAGPINYKNGYRSSSWISMMESRLDISRLFLKVDGIMCATIDDYQVNELAHLLDTTFGQPNRLGTSVIRNNPSGRSTVRGLSVCHEYAFFYQKSETGNLRRLPRSEKQLERFSQEGGIHVDWRNFRKDGGAVTHRAARPKQFYPIYVELSTKRMRIPDLSWNKEAKCWDVLSEPLASEKPVYPIDEKGRERVWSLNHISAIENIQDLEVRTSRDGALQIHRRHIPSDGVLPRSWWDKNTYAAREYGSATLTNMFGESAVFSFAKSPFAVQDSIWISGLADPEGYVLDFFGGSATTGHAVINLNREDRGTRKYIIVEQGEYFDTVTKPRIQKSVYSAEWKDGKATAPSGGLSHAFKVLRLESYEDTLNNLHLTRTPAQQSLLEALPHAAKEDYLLRYMLDIESRGALLSIEQFNKPFDCKLKVAVDSAGAYEERTIDLVETFNYLIGLRVKHIDVQHGLGFVSLTGFLPSGEKTLVLWRDVEKLDYEALNRLCEKLAINPADSEFDVVYLNGDHNIPAAFTSTEAEGGITKTLKIRQIEPEFMSRMFSAEA